MMQTYVPSLCTRGEALRSLAIAIGIALTGIVAMVPYLATMALAIIRLGS